MTKEYNMCVYYLVDVGITKSLDIHLIYTLAPLRSATHIM